MTEDNHAIEWSEAQQLAIERKPRLHDAKEALKAAAAWVEKLVDEDCANAELTRAEVNLRVAMKLYMQTKREQPQ